MGDPHRLMSTALLLLIVVIVGLGLGVAFGLWQQL
jgi:hypothetical protein